MKYLSGRLMNILARGSFVDGSSSDALAHAPVTNLADGDPSAPMILSTDYTNPRTVFDVNALTNPGFQTSTLSGWTDNDQGTGASTETAAGGRSATKGLQLVGSDATTNYASRYQNITVAAGEWRKASVYMNPGVGGSQLSLYIRNASTGNYYNGTSGLWASAREPAIRVIGVGSPGYVLRSMTYQVESFEVCRADTVTLRWELAGEADTSYADDCLDIPGVNFGSVHGHNAGPISCIFATSDDDSVYTNRIIFTIRRGQFWGECSMIYARYLMVFWGGTTHEPLYVGEVVYGQAQESVRGPLPALLTEDNFPGVREMSPAGRYVGYNFGPDPRTDLDLSFLATTLAEAAELTNLWLRSEQGRYPVVIVPVSTEAPVYYGHLMRPFARERPLTLAEGSKLFLSGSPLPTVGL